MSERIDTWYDDLPLLPGEVGVAVLEVTEVYERIEFPDLTPEPSEIAETESSEPMSYAGWTKAKLYGRAKEIGLKGRSRMTKAQLRSALLAI